MRIHIVGAGPTGLSLAWELLRSKNFEVVIYDRKPSAGGSWWEPDTVVRDLHAHRIVFDRAFVNTHSLFREMGIEWNDIFEPSTKESFMIFMSRSLSASDYLELVYLFVKVLTVPSMYKSVTVKEAVKGLSDKGKHFIEHLTLVVDGVTWDVMSIFELVKSIDHVALSKEYTQKVSGKVMCDAMERAVKNAGATFVFNTELKDVTYMDDGYSATFSNDLVIDDGYLFLCVDNSPAIQLIGDNWGPDAKRKINNSTYGAINVLLEYDRPIDVGNDLEIAAMTKWDLQPVVLSDKKTVSCVICNLTKEIMETDPGTLKAEVLDQLYLPVPKKIRIGWGAEWVDGRWTFTQSSGVLSLEGQLPFFGKCPRVAMCGMMSERSTPYSSIEASIEVSRELNHLCFGGRQSIQPLHLSQLLLILFIVLILFYIK